MARQLPEEQSHWHAINEAAWRSSRSPLLRKLHGCSRPRQARLRKNRQPHAGVPKHRSATSVAWCRVRLHADSPAAASHGLYRPLGHAGGRTRQTRQGVKAEGGRGRTAALAAFDDGHGLAEPLNAPDAAELLEATELHDEHAATIPGNDERRRLEWASVAELDADLVVGHADEYERFE